MYSVLLMAAFTAAPDAPAGLIFHRRNAGCQGVVAPQLNGCTGGFASAPSLGCTGVATAAVGAPLPQVSLVSVQPVQRRLLGYRQCGPGQVCAVYE